jgi:hypothetical protein
MFFKRFFLQESLPRHSKTLKICEWAINRYSHMPRGLVL